MGAIDGLGQRLKEERERMSYSQTEFAALAGLGRKSQFNYETGYRLPDAAYLAAIADCGADVGYIVTGSRNGPLPLVLAPDERGLLDRYRAMNKATQKRLLAFMLSMESQK